MQQLQVVLPAPQTVELQAHELPQLGPNQWILRANTTLVSTGTELIVWNGEFGKGSHWDNWIKWPFSGIGYNMVGTVEVVGSDVTAVKVGERFVSRSPHSSRRVFDHGPNHHLVRVPDAIPDEDAVWFGMACIAQVGARRANFSLGDSVAIVGAGILGQFITQYARLSGAKDVFVIDTAPARLELARQGGATQTFETTAGHARDAIFEATGGRGADVVFDITGHPAAFSQGLSLARKYGTFVLLGDAPDPTQQRLTSDIMSRGVKIVGAHDTFAGERGSGLDNWDHGAMTELFFKFLERGQMHVSNMITHRFDATEVPTAYETLARDRSTALGVLFDWTKCE